jgi:hypothetical protein
VASKVDCLKQQLTAAALNSCCRSAPAGCTAVAEGQQPEYTAQHTLPTYGTRAFGLSVECAACSLGPVCQGAVLTVQRGGGRALPLSLVGVTSNSNSVRTWLPVVRGVSATRMWLEQVPGGSRACRCTCYLSQQDCLMSTLPLLPPFPTWRAYMFSQWICQHPSWATHRAPVHTSQPAPLGAWWLPATQHIPLPMLDGSGAFPWQERDGWRPHTHWWVF